MTTDITDITKTRNTRRIIEIRADEILRIEGRWMIETNGQTEGEAREEETTRKGMTKEEKRKRKILRK